MKWVHQELIASLGCSCQGLMNCHWAAVLWSERRCQLICNKYITRGGCCSCAYIGPKYATKCCWWKQAGSMSCQGSPPDSHTQIFSESLVIIEGSIYILSNGGHDTTEVESWMGALLALEALYMMTLVVYSLYHALKVLHVASLFSSSILFLLFFYFILFCVPLSLWFHSHLFLFYMLS